MGGLGQCDDRGAVAWVECFVELVENTAHQRHPGP